jgi:3-oxoadipate enol-lactonase
MQPVERDGVVIHTRADGPARGAPLVLVNSLGTDLRIWDALVMLLGGRSRIVRYDLRGHGLSDGPPGPCRIEDHVADLLAVMDHHGLASAAVAGLSIGGQVALGLAAAVPARVSRLVLCDTAHRIGPVSMWEARMKTVAEAGVEAIASAVLERWFPAAWRQAHPRELALWRNMLVRTPREGYVASCAALRDADLGEAARSLAVPVLCVCGSEDLATPPALVGELAALIPGARLELLHGSGHLPCIDNAPALAALVGAFTES